VPLPAAVARRTYTMLYVTINAVATASRKTDVSPQK